jgi:hypothetical protein
VAQVAEPLCGAGQLVQLAPQWVGSLFVSYAHAVAPPQVLKPALQELPH